MLKKYLLGLSLSLIFSTSLLAAPVFQEGIHFKRIQPAVQTSDQTKVVVTEMFWYGCPHCFRFEPYIQRWAADLPPTVVFEQQPSVLIPSWRDHAKTFYTLSLMSDQSGFHEKLFDAIHRQRQHLHKFELIAEFAGTQGLDEAKFRETFQSFAVNMLLGKNAHIEKKYGHSGVPAVIINGKYFTSGSMAGSNQRMIEVIDFLVNQELA